ncbi:MAG: class I SAM-dependent methyltransferase [Pirellulaceae bacterium]|mgnify:CR=1 FL=1|nr:class I SAM-dependent methyltransferase [Pirellulaceae bacterium]
MSALWLRIFFILIPLTSCVYSLSEAQDQNGAEETAPSALPPPRTTYLGREIALPMSYLGADWLLRKERQEQENCSLMLQLLGSKSGMTVCDMGCGNGFYALQLANIVGETGRVLAVDIQPEMLTLLRARARQEQIDNIQPVLGTVIDPSLPVGKVDLILCVDVYHEFSHPEYMLRAMRKSLSAEGRIVLVEFRSEDPEVPIKKLHKMSRDQIIKEMRHNGLQLANEFNELPWQHMMFFGRDDTWESP